MNATPADDGDDQGGSLPTPNQLVRRDGAVKCTLALSRRSVAFCRREAAQQQVSYQRMIRTLVDEYARRMRRAGHQAGAG